MKPLLFVMPGNESFAAQLRQRLSCDPGDLRLRRFPDGESCLRFMTDVRGRDVALACTLDHPDEKIMPLYLAANIARELGANSVGLIIPYLPYMRQDARFKEGEGVTSAHFARLVSSCCDWLVTVDPHLHRCKSLSDIYTVATRVVHAAPEISRWIVANVDNPVIIGPDSESEQWVAEVAGAARCPFTMLQKERSGDREVKVSFREPATCLGGKPVLVDDIVSTARTMIAAAARIKAAGMDAPICIAVHPLFAGDAYAALHVAGVDRIVSCNTVVHSTNQIDLCQPIAVAVEQMVGTHK